MNTDSIKVPREWRKHEAKARLEIYRWLLAGRPTSLTQLAWHIGHEVYKIAGFVFMDFHERDQRMYIRRPFKDWLCEMVDETREQIEKAKAFASVDSRTVGTK